MRKCFSPIRVMLDKTKDAESRGIKVVPRIAGEPDFDTPQDIKDATIRALNANFTHYSSNRGQPRLRQAISRPIRGNRRCLRSRNRAAGYLRRRGNHQQRAVQNMKDTFAQRRELLLAGLDGIPELGYVRPDGAFYTFVDISQTGLSGEESSLGLFDQKQVATVAGMSFGKGCGDYIRLSFATKEENITRGLHRMKEYIRGL